ncbi:MAG: hypothetical protein ACE5KO_03750 [Candidatus Bathyarchaeia archaeon]
MRYMISGEVPPEVGARLEKNPAEMEPMLKLLESPNIEASYFSASRRAIFLIANIDGGPDAVAKFMMPMWQALNSYPTVEPVLNKQDFKAFVSQVFKK